jgi:anti-sigma-K factor RskA
VVSEWEWRLNPLGNPVGAITPYPRVWRNIRREIAADSRQRHEPFWSSLLLSQTTTVFAVITLAGLLTYRILVPIAVQTIWAPAVAPVPSFISVLVNKRRAPMIVATATKPPQHLIIVIIQKPKVCQGKDLKFWAIPQKGGAPFPWAYYPRIRNRHPA